MPYIASNNGMTVIWHDPGDGYQPKSGEVSFAAAPSPTQLAAAFPGYTAAMAQQAAVNNATALIVAGIQIASTGTPTLNGTYAIDSATKTVIDGIYSGIKGGDGLPGGGQTFNYADMAGAMHAFDATSFPNFAKAVRDYLYAISQGSTPALPVTIA